ncbi:MAG: hypothetical protein IH852_09380 [Bacteroidetes bacterium]|nr:hypothetical protein [Bacteroidota bacterium]
MSNRSILILREKKITFNGDSFVYPLFTNRKLLQEYGINVSFVKNLNDNLSDCDVLIISSNVASENGWWVENKKDEMFSFLDRMEKGVDNVIWADLRDGTGTTFFEILPHVDRYFKGFLLKDRLLYRRKFYGSRYFTDYYHKHFQVSDDNPGEPHLNHIPEESELRKVVLSWNNSFNNFSYIGNIIRKVNKHINIFPHQIFNSMKDPQKGRSVFYNCRIGTNYRRNTISFPRKKIAELLRDKVSTNRVNKYKYYRELNNSRVVISPFGWGEACYRDYEAFNAGATLIKPNCSHMETWPDYYVNNQTYLPFKWDFSDFKSLIDSLPDKYSDLISIAVSAQKRYKYFLFSDSGKAEFCERFNMLTSFTE